MSTVKSPTKNGGNGREYVLRHDGDTVSVPSVNTLANQLAKPALNGWLINRHIEAARIIPASQSFEPMKFRRQVRAEVNADRSAIDRGNLFHETIEAYLLDEQPPEAPEWMGVQATDIIDTLELEPMRTEHGDLVEAGLARVQNGRVTYAGTSDLISADGWLYDWKTKDAGADLSVYPDAMLTTTAYAMCNRMIVGRGELVNTDFDINGARVVAVSADGWRVYELDDPTLIESCGLVFDALSAIYQFRETSEPALVGSPVAAGTGFKP